MKKENRYKLKWHLCFSARVGIVLLLFAGLIYQPVTAQNSLIGAIANANQVSEDVDLNKIRTSVNFNNIPLDEAILTLGAKAGITFNYNGKVIPKNASITFKAEDLSVTEILDSILPDGVEYLVVRDVVVLKDAQSNIIENDLEAFDETVKGQVTDAATEEPIPGVNVFIKDTSIGTTTDFNGEFELSVPDLEVVLSFSFVGYISQDVGLNGRSEVTVSLEQDIQMLDDIIVVGESVK